MVGGVWHQRRSGRSLAITVEPLRELTATQLRQLDAEVALVGEVMETKPTLRLRAKKRSSRWPVLIPTKVSLEGPCRP